MSNERITSCEKLISVTHRDYDREFESHSLRFECVSSNVQRGFETIQSVSDPIACCLQLIHDLEALRYNQQRWPFFVSDGLAGRQRYMSRRCLLEGSRRP